MVDIETMGTKSFSSLTSIGAVEFNLETGEVGETFLINIDLKSSVDCGLIIDPNTVMWWLSQDKESQNRLMVDCKSLPQSLAEFRSFFIGREGYNVWGNSARFDMGLLENAYNTIGEKIPWSYRNERCVRTLSGMFPDIKEGVKFTGIKHDALDDCLHQIKYCHETYKKLKTSI